MDLVFGGVAIRVGADPAVVLDGRVRRLRGIPDVVSEPPRVEDRRLLYWGGVLVGGRELAILAQCSLQALPHLNGFPWLQSHPLRSLACRKDFCFEIEPPARQGTEGIDRLQVNKVFGSLRSTEF